jgi:hypothetical protein
MIKACRTLSLFLITGVLFAQSPNRNAGRELNELFDGIDASTGVIQNTSLQISRERREPVWVNNPYAVYDRNIYIAQVGHAATRSDAEKNALSQLASVFELSIQSDFITDTVYSETILKGKLVVSENTRVRDTIITAASMDKLIGAQIVNIWENPRGTVYALAHINKQRTAAIYLELIRINQINIENLIRMNEAEKNTLNGVARYKLAAQIAEMNKKYANVILVAGGQIADLNLYSAGFNSLSLNDEAQKIIKNTTVVIDIIINVDGETYNDNGNRNRIRDAVARVIEGERLQTVRGNNSLYRFEMDVNIDTSTRNNIFYSNYRVSSILMDSAGIEERRTFNVISGTQFMSTRKDAIDDSFTIIERKINEQISFELKEFLRKLIPEI